MPAISSENGIEFQYPENWKRERESIDGGWAVTVQSPDTAFLMVCLRTDKPSPAEMAEEALADLRDDYPDLEADRVSVQVAGHHATGFDAKFFAFDLTNSVSIRSFSTLAGTVLVLWQMNDLETEKYDLVMKAICHSLHAS